MLTKTEKIKLDKRIDAGFQHNLKVLSLPKSLLHILRAAEFRNINNDLQVREQFGVAAGEPATDVTREAVHLSIVAIAENEDQVHCSSKKADLDAALDLLKVTADYAEMSDIMTLSFLNGVSLEPINDSDYELSMTKEQIEHEAAQWLWRLKQYVEPPAPRETLDRVRPLLHVVAVRW